MTNELTKAGRINYAHESPALFKRMMELSQALEHGLIEQPIRDLVSIRASQLNGCAFCLDMHVKQARIHGERELRLHHVAIWRESTLFTARERASLAWTETLTRLPECGVSGDVYNDARKEFSEKELSDLTFAIMVINAWNRVNVAFQSVPGSFDAMLGLAQAGLH